MVGLVRGFKGLKIPSSFTVSSNTQSIQIDHPYQILWTLLPEDSTNTDIFWNSSDESIAIVDEGGLITPVSVGECTITGHTASNWLIQTIAVTTYVVHPTGVELNMNTMTLEPGTPQQLIATVLPELTNYPEVTWSSSDDSIATVDSDGLVTYVADGNCTITCTTVDGGFTDTCSVQCVIPVTGVTLNKTSGEVSPGETLQLTATITPSDATIKIVTWTSSDTSIATVDSNGLVTYISEGNCIITCTTVDGGYTDTCSVTAKVPAFDFYYDFRGGSLAGFQAAGGTGIYTNGSYTIDSGGLGQTGSSNDRNTHAYVTGLNFQGAKLAYIERLGYWISAAWSNGKGMGFGTSYNGGNGFDGPGVWGRINLNTSSPGTYSTNGINYYPNDPVTHYEKYAATGGETTEHLEIDFVNNVAKYVLTGANSKTFTINLTEALKQNLFGMTGVGWNWGRGYSSYNSERIRWVKIHIEY